MGVTDLLPGAQKRETREETVGQPEEGENKRKNMNQKRVNRKEKSGKRYPGGHAKGSGVALRDVGGEECPEGRFAAGSGGTLSELVVVDDGVGQFGNQNWALSTGNGSVKSFAIAWRTSSSQSICGGSVKKLWARVCVACCSGSDPPRKIKLDGVTISRRWRGPAVACSTRTHIFTSTAFLPRSSFSVLRLLLVLSSFETHKGHEKNKRKKRKHLGATTPKSLFHPFRPRPLTQPDERTQQPTRQRMGTTRNRDEFEKPNPRRRHAGTASQTQTHARTWHGDWDFDASGKFNAFGSRRHHVIFFSAGSGLLLSFEHAVDRSSLKP